MASHTLASLQIAPQAREEAFHELRGDCALGAAGRHEAIDQCRGVRCDCTAPQIAGERVARIEERQPKPQR